MRIVLWRLGCGGVDDLIGWVATRCGAGAMAATASNTSLHQPPTDGVTALEYSRNDAKLLLVSSWDTVCAACAGERSMRAYTLTRWFVAQGVRLFDTSLNSLRHYYTHKAAVLDATFGEDDNHVVSGGLAQSVWMYVHMLPGPTCRAASDRFLVLAAAL